MTDSSTGGYVVPAASPAPLQDTALEDFLQTIVVGITGLSGTLVRPRWQPEPPNMPDIGTNWAALGVGRRQRDFTPAVIHDPDGNGRDLLLRHQTLDVLVSFYGPRADEYADLLADGLQIPQNREAMKAVGFALVESGDSTPVPTLVKERWLRRVDLPLVFNRQVRRYYPILNLLSAVIESEAIPVSDVGPADIVIADSIVVVET